jgi:hypothetical protein
MASSIFRLNHRWASRKRGAVADADWEVQIRRNGRQVEK